MRIILWTALLLALLAGGCAVAPAPAIYDFEPPERRLDYFADVEPVLVSRCVVCHSCYNSPCQLKLSSWEGFDRGASKEKIYNASRLTTMEPSRLLIDAHSARQWRTKGFFGIKPEEGSAQYDESLLHLLLDHKREHPQVSGAYYPEADDLTCAETSAELRDYLRKHPNRGMPFGFPPLKRDEFNTIVGWLSQGARGPSPFQQVELEAVPSRDQAMLERWERLLNDPAPKFMITARYLYEHLFLAHITFGTGSNTFYELVRSRSGPGGDIDIIATVRPYDDPETDRFFYRFRKIHSVIVSKTHMVFACDERQYRRVSELFIAPEWPEPPHAVGYDVRLSANPFETFAQIPARSRYEWLLDNAHYVISTFIKGPVCKGQVALNVINDHFWLLFLDPGHDLAVRYPGFTRLHYDNLRMPIEKGSSYRLVSALLKNDHYRRAIDYYRARQDFYAAHYPQGLDLSALWRGSRADDQPVLTVFRHFDSGSVHRGVLGNLPRTVWVLDYPLLERIYYALVAGFDIYGTAGHQLSIRLYMDALRIEGESYFLDFMPQHQREAMMHSWYGGVVPDKVHYFPAPIPAGIAYQTAEPKRELLETFVKTGLRVEGISFDQNYRAAGVPYPGLPSAYETVADYITGFIAVSAPGVSFFRHITDFNANLAWVRIKNIAGMEDRIISIVVDRWHDNVKFMRREDLRLDPARDRADFIEGFIGSYPNYFFVVDAGDLPDFLEILDNYDGSAAFVERLGKYGVNRADAQFWEVYDWFQARLDRTGGNSAGLIDLNRYYHLATARDREGD